MTDARNPATGRREKFWTITESRFVLVTLGGLTVGIGGLVLLNDVAPRQYLAIALWLVAALIVHDVVIAGIVFAVVILGRKAARTLPRTAITIIQCALAIGAIVALLVAPEIVKKSIGTANPSILPLDYGLNLAIFLVVLALATVVGIVLHAALARQASGRTGS